MAALVIVWMAAGFVGVSGCLLIISSSSLSYSGCSYTPAGALFGSVSISLFVIFLFRSFLIGGLDKKSTKLIAGVLEGCHTRAWSKLSRNIFQRASFWFCEWYFFRRTKGCESECMYTFVCDI